LSLYAATDPTFTQAASMSNLRVANGNGNDNDTASLKLPVDAKDDKSESLASQKDGLEIKESEHIGDKGAIIEPEMTPQDDQTIIDNEAKNQSPEVKDYSSFTTWEKRFIVFTATIGAFFSPFTAQIYFPALTSIAKDLNISYSKVNLTMTTYMVRIIFPNIIAMYNDLPDFASHCTSIYWWLL